MQYDHVMGYFMGGDDRGRPLGVVGKRDASEGDVESRFRRLAVKAYPIFVQWLGRTRMDAVDVALIALMRRDKLRPVDPFTTKGSGVMMRGVQGPRRSIIGTARGRELLTKVREKVPLTAVLLDEGVVEDLRRIGCEMRASDYVVWYRGNGDPVPATQFHLPSGYSARRIDDYVPTAEEADMLVEMEEKTRKRALEALAMRHAAWVVGPDLFERGYGLSAPHAREFVGTVNGMGSGEEDDDMGGVKLSCDGFAELQAHGILSMDRWLVVLVSMVETYGEIGEAYLPGLEMLYRIFAYMGFARYLSGGAPRVMNVATRPSGIELLINPRSYSISYDPDRDLYTRTVSPRHLSYWVDDPHAREVFLDGFKVGDRNGYRHDYQVLESQTGIQLGYRAWMSGDGHRLRTMTCACVDLFTLVESHPEAGRVVSTVINRCVEYLIEQPGERAKKLDKITGQLSDCVGIITYIPDLARTDTDSFFNVVDSRVEERQVFDSRRLQHMAMWLDEQLEGGSSLRALLDVDNLSGYHLGWQAWMEPLRDDLKRALCGDDVDSENISGLINEIADHFIEGDREVRVSSLLIHMLWKPSSWEGFAFTQMANTGMYETRSELYDWDRDGKSFPLNAAISTAVASIVEKYPSETAVRRDFVGGFLKSTSSGGNKVRFTAMVDEMFDDGMRKVKKVLTSTKKILVGVVGFADMMTNLRSLRDSAVNFTMALRSVAGRDIRQVYIIPMVDLYATKGFADVLGRMLRSTSWAGIRDTEDPDGRFPMAHATTDIMDKLELLRIDEVSGMMVRNDVGVVGVTDGISHPQSFILTQAVGSKLYDLRSAMVGSSLVSRDATSSMFCSDFSAMDHHNYPVMRAIGDSLRRTTWRVGSWYSWAETVVVRGVAGLRTRAHSIVDLLSHHFTKKNWYEGKMYGSAPVGTTRGGRHGWGIGSLPSALEAVGLLSGQFYTAYLNTWVNSMVSLYSSLRAKVFIAATLAMKWGDDNCEYIRFTVELTFSQLREMVRLKLMGIKECGQVCELSGLKLGIRCEFLMNKVSGYSVVQRRVALGAERHQRMDDITGLRSAMMALSERMARADGHGRWSRLLRVGVLAARGVDRTHAGLEYGYPFDDLLYSQGMWVGSQAPAGTRGWVTSLVSELGIQVHTVPTRPPNRGVGLEDIESMEYRGVGSLEWQTVGTNDGGVARGPVLDVEFNGAAGGVERDGTVKGAIKVATLNLLESKRMVAEDSNLVGDLVYNNAINRMVVSAVTDMISEADGGRAAIVDSLYSAGRRFVRTPVSVHPIIDATETCFFRVHGPSGIRFVQARSYAEAAIVYNNDARFPALHIPFPTCVGGYRVVFELLGGDLKRTRDSPSLVSVADVYGKFVPRSRKDISGEEVVRVLLHAWRHGGAIDVLMRQMGFSDDEVARVTSDWGSMRVDLLEYLDSVTAEGSISSQNLDSLSSDRVPLLLGVTGLHLIEQHVLLSWFVTEILAVAELQLPRESIGGKEVTVVGRLPVYKQDQFGAAFSARMRRDVDREDVSATWINSTFKASGRQSHHRIIHTNK